MRAYVFVKPGNLLTGGSNGSATYRCSLPYSLTANVPYSGLSIAKEQLASNDVSNNLFIFQCEQGILVASQ